jgi:hypothetical protein
MKLARRKADEDGGLHRQMVGPVRQGKESHIKKV